MSNSNKKSEKMTEEEAAKLKEELWSNYNTRKYSNLNEIMSVSSKVSQKVIQYVGEERAAYLTGPGIMKQVEETHNATKRPEVLVHFLLEKEGGKIGVAQEWINMKTKEVIREPIWWKKVRLEGSKR